ncbi:MAG: hypothetical protein Q9219_001541 [cf. Caloplaca sp. 3 TL-2023]
MVQKYRKQILLEYLTLPNPKLDCSQCPEGGNTEPSSSRSTRACPTEITDWEDFGVSSIDAEYDGAVRKALKRLYSLGEDLNLRSFPFREPHDEDSLESVLILWTWQVVSEALAAAQKDIWGHHSPQAIYMVRGGQAYLPGGDLKGATGPRRRPDWAAVQRVYDGQGCLATGIKSKTMLPGDTKTSIKWHSSQIKKGPVDRRPKSDWYKPIGQIYDYCRRANARYGYLITDQELVVIQVDFDKSDVQTQRLKIAHGERARFSFKAIPWNANHVKPGANGEIMTVNLALWLLHLAAVQNPQITDFVNLLAEPSTARGESVDLDANGEPLRRSRRNTAAKAPPNTSFRSATSDIRNKLGSTAIGDDEDALSSSPLKNPLKRGVDEVLEDVTKHGLRRGIRSPKKRH